MANQNTTPTPELIDTEVRVLELRKTGMTWTRISELTGYADASGAYRAYIRALKRVVKEPAEQVRTLEIERLDYLWNSLMAKATDGDPQAIGVMLRIMERRSRLLGLDAPTKVQQEVTTWEGGDSIDRAVRELAEALSASNGDRGSESSVDENRSESESVTS